MATLKPNKESDLMQRIKPLLNPYEEFTIQNDYPGVSGYLISLKTNTYIHRRHTKKDLFIPHSVYQASTTTALPSKEFIVELLKHARISIKRLLDKGEYTAEVKVGGEWQNVKRRYNQYVFFDKKNQYLVGEVHHL